MCIGSYCVNGMICVHVSKVFISLSHFSCRGQPKCLQRHGALLQLVRAAIMVLKSEHTSQMEHLQAIEKVSAT